MKKNFQIPNFERYSSIHQIRFLFGVKIMPTGNRFFCLLCSIRFVEMVERQIYEPRAFTFRAFRVMHRTPPQERNKNRRITNMMKIIGERKAVAARLAELGRIKGKTARDRMVRYKDSRYRRRRVETVIHATRYGSLRNGCPLSMVPATYT